MPVPYCLDDCGFVVRQVDSSGSILLSQDCFGYSRFYVFPYKYSILTHIYGILKDGNNNPKCKTEKETQMYRTDFWTLWEKSRVGCSERIALKQVYYQG